MGLLDWAIEQRGKAEARRAEMLGPVLDRLEAASAERKAGQAQQSYGKAAAALNLNAPDIGAIALLARSDPSAASSLLTQAAQARTPQAQQAQQLGALQIEGQGLQNKVNEQRLQFEANQDRRAQQQLDAYNSHYRHNNQHIHVLRADDHQH
jgi:hypothetical protein